MSAVPPDLLLAELAPAPPSEAGGRTPAPEREGYERARFQRALDTALDAEPGDAEAVPIARLAPEPTATPGRRDALVHLFAAGVASGEATDAGPPIAPDSTPVPRPPSDVPGRASSGAPVTLPAAPPASLAGPVVAATGAPIPAPLPSDAPAEARLEPAAADGPRSVPSPQRLPEAIAPASPAPVPAAPAVARPNGDASPEPASALPLAAVAAESFAAPGAPRSPARSPRDPSAQSVLPADARAEPRTPELVPAPSEPESARERSAKDVSGRDALVFERFDTSARAPAPVPLTPPEAPPPPAPAASLPGPGLAPAPVDGTPEAATDVQAPLAPRTAAAVAQQLEALATRGGGVARVQLSPPHLGEVELRVSVRGEAVEVVLNAQDRDARAALLESGATLAEGLATRALRLGHFEVVGAPMAHGESAAPGHEQSRDGSPHAHGGAGGEGPPSERHAARGPESDPTPTPARSEVRTRPSDGSIDLRV